VTGAVEAPIAIHNMPTCVDAVDFRDNVWMAGNNNRRQVIGPHRRQQAEAHCDCCANHHAKLAAWLHDWGPFSDEAHTLRQTG